MPDSRLGVLAEMYHPKKVTPATVEFVDDALRTCEESIADALNAIRQTRSQFQAIINPASTRESPIIEDV